MCSECEALLEEEEGHKQKKPGAGRPQAPSGLPAGGNPVPSILWVRRGVWGTPWLLFIHLLSRRSRKKVGKRSQVK